MNVGEAYEFRYIRDKNADRHSESLYIRERNVDKRMASRYM